MLLSVGTRIENESKKDFFNKNEEALALCHRLLDIVIIIISALLVHYFIYDNFVLNFSSLNMVVYGVLTAIIIFPKFSVYEFWHDYSIWEEIESILIPWAAMLFLLTFISYITKTGSNSSVIWVSYWFISIFMLMTLSRYATKKISLKLQQSSSNIRKGVIYGAGSFGTSILEKLQQEHCAGIDVVGFFDDDTDSHGDSISGVPILGGLNVLMKNLTAYNVNTTEELVGGKDVLHIWIALPLHSQHRIKEILAALENTTAQVHLVLDPFGINLIAQKIDNFVGIPVVNFANTPIVGIEALLKNLMDKVVSTLAIIALSPIMLIIAILIKLESTGPILFKQKRYGLAGNEIEVWKFRSMSVCEDDNNVRQATKNDARITKVGKFIRSTSLDELPQFFNVLQGTMSIVGPRPHPLALDKMFGEKIKKYMIRHTVKPGITGWAQVNGARGETETKEKMERRIKYDLEYIERWNIWLDIKILLMTPYKVFHDKAAY